MGRLLVTEFVTLDGVMEAPGGEPTHVHTGWVELVTTCLGIVFIFTAISPSYVGHAPAKLS